MKTKRVESGQERKNTERKKVRKRVQIDGSVVNISTVLAKDLNLFPSTHIS